MSTWSPTDHWDVRCDDCGELAGTRAETENAPAGRRARQRLAPVTAMADLQTLTDDLETLYLQEIDGEPVDLDLRD